MKRSRSDRRFQHSAEEQQARGAPEPRVALSSMPSRPLDVYVIHHASTLAQLSDDVRRLDDLGVHGVLLTDHLFMSHGKPRVEAQRPNEPMVVLGAIAALSSRLRLGTIVSNIGLLHPALVLRQFAQLAALVGGERVVAGLGAGWNREEFEALGMPMPRFGERLQRLEEAADLGRQLFDHGIAALDGTSVVARDLPESPLPATKPRILLGGGSDRLLDIAGRYADMLDLNGTSRSPAVAGRDLPTADIIRKLSTTMDELERSVPRVRTASVAAGRPAEAVGMTIMLGFVARCNAAEVPAVANRFRTRVGLPEGPLDACPYALIGEPSQIADALAERRERLQLEAVLLGGNPDWETIATIRRLAE